MDPSDLKRLPTYLNLPEDMRGAWLDKAQSFPPSWIEKLHNKQHFQSSEDCLCRLNAYGFVQGCLFVTAKQGGGPDNRIWYFRCSFHSPESLNTRKLESRVARDQDNNITTKRKRDTQTKKKDCPVLYCLSYKIVNWDTKERGYVGGWKEDHHENHMLHLNPFSFPVHQQSIDAYQIQVAAAIRLRVAKQPYSMACQLLEDSSNGLLIGKRAYYNLTVVRDKLADKERDDTITALLYGLREDNFRFATRTTEELEVQEDGTDKVISRKLVQIFFYHIECAQLARRFTAGHVIIVDGTFNTNQLRLPLLVAVGITNEGRTFPIAFSFCPGETTESYNFFFESIRSEIFGVDGALEPAIVMGDMGTGLLSSIDIHDSMPNSMFQICSWHAIEAMMAHFRQSRRYTDLEMEGPQDEKSHKTGPGLVDWCWQYVKSSTPSELDKNRQTLYGHLQELERQYMKKNWEPREPRVINHYTRILANLGIESSQRVESYHKLLKDVVSGHFPLKDSTKAISRRVIKLVVELRTEEDNALLKVPFALDRRFFENLIGKISLVAIKQIETEWLQMVSLLQRGQELGNCETCDILNRHSLPCRHFLRRAYDEGAPIPRSLIHPRWWLRGPVIQDPTWSPYYGAAPPMPLVRPSLSGQTLLPNFYALRQIQDELPEEEAFRFSQDVNETTTNLLVNSQKQKEVAKIPIQNPNSVRYKFFKKKEGAQNGQNERGLTANELAKANNKKAQQTEKQIEKNSIILRARSQKPRAQASNLMQPLPQAQVDRENDKKIEALKAEGAARQKQILAEQTIPATKFPAPGAIQPAAILASCPFQHSVFVQKVLEEGQKEREAAAAQTEREEEEEEERACQETLRIEAQNVIEAALEEEASAFVRTQRTEYEAKKQADITRVPSPPLTNLGEQSQKLAKELKRLEGVIRERRGFEPTPLPHQVEARERLQEEVEERCNAVYEVLEGDNIFTSDGRAPPIHLWDGGKGFTDPTCVRNFEADALLPIPEPPQAPTPPTAPIQTGIMRFNFPSWMKHSKPAPPSLPPPPPPSNKTVALPLKRKRDTRKFDEALTHLAPKKRKT